MRQTKPWVRAIVTMAMMMVMVVMVVMLRSRTVEMTICLLYITNLLWFKYQARRCSERYIQQLHNIWTQICIRIHVITWRLCRCSKLYDFASKGIPCAVRLTYRRCKQSMASVQESKSRPTMAVVVTITANRNELVLLLDGVLLTVVIQR